ncbi:fumarylacetoacetase [Pseudopelagicola sp. nBUS_19]|uniref:fumarylacetoacetase n=1 Tax=unclassified Pseudopelagicola TaxID=2649563 RepID=UPI003EC03188
MPLLKSWVASANSATHPFPLNNLPYGVFSTPGSEKRCGVAIGDMILDMAAAEGAGMISVSKIPVFNVPYWNEFMHLGATVWASLRTQLTQLLSEDSICRDQLEPFMLSMEDVTLHMPIVVSEYTDFYSGKNHAFNVGSMFRGPENALPPNWLSIPIGYNGRASSVVVSGTDIRRPWGQIKSSNDVKPRWAPSTRFDIELEIGAIVGTASNGPITVQEANQNIFGYVLLNDWSARDIQAWEYQPLGPFQAKATATSISAWIVTKSALKPFRADTPEREFELLDHLKDVGPMLYDIDLEVSMSPEGKEPTVIAKTNYTQMYYSAAQQLAHHTTAGSPMNVGDLLGSGTISGPTKPECGSLLELSWGGKEPFKLDTGETRSFINDGDTLTLKGKARGAGYTIGFGDCIGKVLPALTDPYAH